MASLKDHIQNYIVRFSNRTKVATRPLKDHFGINYFFYYRIDNTGKFTVLVDRPDWIEHYEDKQLYLGDPYLRHPSVYQSGICRIENHGSDEFKELVLKEVKMVLDMDTRILLIQKKDSYAEFFGFYGNSGTSSLQSLYLNRPQLLKSFASHFKKELCPILNKMEQDPVFLPDLKGQDFFCKQPICPDIPSANLVAYYKDLGLKYEFDQVEKLSSRERQCLKLLVEDKSAKETGVLLGLSRRTIEFYFENIKNKLSCYSKHEVLAIARTFEEAGLL